MGLFQNACETYDVFQNRIGEYIAGREALAPIAHTIKSATIEVTIDIDGRFITASIFDKKEQKIIVPATEDALSRSSSAVAPYPLCDQVCYLAAYDDKSKRKHQKYLEQLSGWVVSEYGDPKIEAIYRYVSKNTLVNDLLQAGVMQRDENGGLKSEKDFIAWKVIGGDGENTVWKDKKLMKKFIKYSEVLIKNKPKNICMVSGEYEPILEHHLKGIFACNGNAKLISANDTRNFTFLGRFNTADEALTVSYNSSQKAHNALKWLLANQSVSHVIGGRAVLCWCPQGDRIPHIDRPVLPGISEVNDRPTTPSEYKDLLLKTIHGYSVELKNKITSKTVIVCFDAATSGRLSVTMYSEMMTETFLKKLERWDENCVWFFHNNISSPSISKIVEFAFGNERDRTGNGRVELEDKIKKQHTERLIHCRIGENLFPTDIEQCIVQKASNLMNYGKYSKRDLLSTACAVIKKYYYDRKREVLSMNLEESRRDRSYQFGRLLAIYEKIERDTFDASETREPNAIRLQSGYCNQPMHYAHELDKQMERAYFPRLSVGARIYYKNLIGEIMGNISSFPENTWNKQLKDTYLMGYYLQRKNLYTKNSKTDND